MLTLSALTGEFNCVTPNYDIFYPFETFSASDRFSENKIKKVSRGKLTFIRTYFIFSKKAKDYF